MDMKKINFAIIGCGDVTEKKSGPAFNKIEGSYLKSVMRRDKEKLVDYANRHKIENYTTDYLDILKDESIDAVYIATPPNMHLFYTLEAAKYKKAIYVEKPMALTVKECKEMIEVCKEEGVPLFVAYYRREHDKFKKAKELVELNEIGEVRSFHYRYTSKTPTLDPNRSWLLRKEVAGGGLLYDIGSHMIDTMIYLFGEVKEAAGISSNQSKQFDVNDVTSGFIKFKNQIQGSIQLTFNGSEHEDKLTILGSKGTIELSIMSNEDITITKDGVVNTITFPNMEHVQMPLIKRVVNTLLSKDVLESTGMYGLRTQELLETFDNNTSIHYD